MKEITIENEIYVIIKREELREKLVSCNKTTGDWNTGHYNTGDWNKCNYSNGYFNTIEQEFYMFNKKTDIDRDDINFPSFFRFSLTEFVAKKDMTDEEKTNNKNYKNLEGYLKKLDYKEEFRKSWDKAHIEERKKILLVPNFDNEIFKEISGIDVNLELGLIK